MSREYAIPRSDAAGSILSGFVTPKMRQIADSRRRAGVAQITPKMRQIADSFACSRHVNQNAENLSNRRN